MFAFQVLTQSFNDQDSHATPSTSVHNQDLTRQSGQSSPIDNANGVALFQHSRTNSTNIASKSYEPELNRNNNPHYFDWNRRLFNVHMENKLQRSQSNIMDTTDR